MPVNETGTYWDPVSICNAALGMLGDVGKARRMRSMSRGANTLPIHEVAIDFYFAAKEQMHAMMDWKRTRKVKELTLKVDNDGENEAPVLSGKWTYKYVRPPDCLIFRKVLDTDGTEWEYDLVVEESVKSTNTREAGYGEYYNDEYIYCNVADALGWYTILIGEERYVPGMGQLHAMILAQQLAMSTTGKIGVRAGLAQELQVRAERLCMALGAKEGYVEKEEGENEYTEHY